MLRVSLISSLRNDSENALAAFLETEYTGTILADRCGSDRVLKKTTKMRRLLNKLLGVSFTFEKVAKHFII